MSNYIPTAGNQSEFTQLPLIDGIVRLAWVAVPMAMIIAIYRLVDKAIDGDRNVELAWKITENATGRLVIKKVPVQRKARDKRSEPLGIGSQPVQAGEPSRKR